MNCFAERTNVLILGGGMAGLAAAYTLQAAGMHDFLLLEAADRLGGRVRDVKFCGMRNSCLYIQSLSSLRCAALRARTLSFELLLGVGGAREALVQSDFSGGEVQQQNCFDPKCCISQIKHSVSELIRVECELACGPLITCECYAFHFQRLSVARRSQNFHEREFI